MGGLKRSFHRGPGRITLAGVLVIVLALLGHHPAGASQRGATNGRLWTVVPTERPGSVSDWLNGVAATARDSAWAVGFEFNGPEKVLIEHWDGRVWGVVATPELPIGAGQPVLLAVEAVSASDVWAVGCSVDSNADFRSLILHWDGKAWGLVVSPNSPLGQSCLDGVAAVGPDDVWAVGEALRHDESGGAPLLEHWDGTSWSVVPGPGDPDRYYRQPLIGVEAIASNDVWAVGGTVRRFGSVGRPLVQHWDGTRWSRVPTPDLGPYGGDLADVAAPSGSDVWAVGERSVTAAESVPLIEHFDGTSWTTVPTPAIDGQGGLDGVVVRSPTSVWAVGERLAGYEYELRERWDGVEWRTVEGPENPGSILIGLAAAGPGELWAVGVADVDGYQHVLAERYGVPFCADGLDNDGDGTIDYPADAGCTSAIDGSEFLGTACDDGLDNDRDGTIDYPADAGCTSIKDRTEKSR